MGLNLLALFFVSILFPSLKSRPYGAVEIIIIIIIIIIVVVVVV